MTDKERRRQKRHTKIRSKAAPLLVRHRAVHDVCLCFLPLRARGGRDARALRGAATQSRCCHYTHQLRDDGQGAAPAEAAHQDQVEGFGHGGAAEDQRVPQQQHTYVQVIDDENQTTLCAVGTMSVSIKEKVGKEEWATKTVTAANEVGKALGAMCVEKGIKKAVFDRGGFVYHGRVKAVAEGCREAGVEF
eukprot:CAMPEP_0197133532 /NCGR_PEP_ID=MMETSP1390-20130617/25927_1 /TAXON_ID=38833 /ORGANISM="Micromonas sp., Strain CCMP2099" /LENGTH=190 /DNA_ID=CAMNT_0042576229 /DNA_START=504 /DNA_END=1077 /DNA_ORIENTATION=+